MSLRQVKLNECLFIHHNRYKEHLMIHLREQRAKDGHDVSDLYFYCDKCDKKYARLSILRDHIRRDHGDGPKRTYNCPECPATFVRRRSLYYHRNMKHGKDNKFREEAFQCCRDISRH